MACYSINCDVAALRSRLWYQWFVMLKVLAKVIDPGFRLNFGTIEELGCSGVGRRGRVRGRWCIQVPARYKTWQLLFADVDLILTVGTLCP